MPPAPSPAGPLLSLQVEENIGYIRAASAIEAVPLKQKGELPMSNVDDDLELAARLNALGEPIGDMVGDFVADYCRPDEANPTGIAAVDMTAVGSRCNRRLSPTRRRDAAGRKPSAELGGWSWPPRSPALPPSADRSRPCSSRTRPGRSTSMSV